MPIFALMELFAIFLAILFIVTQLLFPALRGTLLFPMFRKERTLQKMILEQRQTAIEKELERTIAETEKVLNPPAPAEDSNVVPPKEIV